MAVTATANSPHLERGPFSEVTKPAWIREAAMTTATTAFVGWAFNIIHPIGGAICGLTSVLAWEATEHIQHQATRHYEALAIARFVGGLALGTVIAAAIGFQVTVFGAIGFALATLILRIAIVIQCHGLPF